MKQWEQPVRRVVFTLLLLLFVLMVFDFRME